MLSKSANLISCRAGVLPSETGEREPSDTLKSMHSSFLPETNRLLACFSTRSRSIVTVIGKGG